MYPDQGVNMQQNVYFSFSFTEGPKICGSNSNIIVLKHWYLLVILMTLSWLNPQHLSVGITQA